MKKVSVIIPTFNREKTIERAVLSVLNQTYENLECLVIDDGSSDRTRDILHSIDDSRLKIYFLEKNSGVSAARNFGVRQSRGDWVALLDSDDEWLPNKLEIQLSYSKKNPEIPLIHGEEIWIRKGKRVNAKKIHKKSGGKIFSRCLHLCLISPSATLMKKSLYEEMKGFNEEYPVCEDYELWLRITSQYEIGFIEEPIIVKYGGHEDQLSTKYKAMDFWRVKAMDEVSTFVELNKKDSLELRRVLLKKCKILKAGYIKHKNLSQLPFIEQLIKKYSLPVDQNDDS